MQFLSRILIAAILSASAASLTAQVRPSPARLSNVTGQLSDPGGLPLRGAAVYAIRISPQRWTSTVQTSGYKGQFTLSGLHPGTYMLCAYVRYSAQILNPCQWQTTANTFRVVEGQPAAALSLRLVRGREVTIEVDDSDATFSTAARGNVRRFEAAVVSPLLLQPRPLKSRPIGGRTFALTAWVPPGNGHSVELRSSGLRVEDDRQLPTPDRISIPEKGNFKQRLRISAAATAR